VTPERCKIREASLITGLDIRTLQEKAARGEIPGAEKPFGRWTFDVAKLRHFARKDANARSLSENGIYWARFKVRGHEYRQSAYERVLRRSRSAG
jgi:hypothetical protein